MADYNCSACSELREDAPNFINYGLTSTEVTSLQNNTGLNPSSGNDDCTDLNNMNDCLIGNMETEVDAYEVCDWKTFMKKHIANLWTVLKGIIASICGLWTQTERMDCIIDYLSSGHTFRMGEVYADNTKSHIVAGKGVSFLNVGETGTSSNISITYVGGGLARMSGSCIFYTSDFTDADTVYSFDTSATNPVYTKSRKGNPAWNGADTKPDNGSGTKGSELIYELRILKSEYPEISRFFTGMGHEMEGGGYRVNYIYFPSGVYANGQHGDCDTYTGEPSSSGEDRGHLVPTGWMYVQCRMSWIDQLSGSATGHQYSPHGLLGMRMNADQIDC